MEGGFHKCNVKASVVRVFFLKSIKLPQKALLFFFNKAGTVQ